MDGIGSSTLESGTEFIFRRFFLVDLDRISQYALEIFFSSITFLTKRYETKVFELYLKSAVAGCIEGQYNLVYCFNYGTFLYLNLGIKARRGILCILVISRNVYYRFSLFFCRTSGSIYDLEILVSF
ncbi:hypothetical protein C1645_790460 [Glomus cerebriforme]|uniref:Uncharacterized protein n=1 Tax=Glomus cerebriforme TaxID=658196 RepID=A0A397S4W3_9GLOM|nr:hypothetical protein C1645_790460 [Glomus cerebriforme]